MDVSSFLRKFRYVLWNKNFWICKEKLDLFCEKLKKKVDFIKKNHVYFCVKLNKWFYQEKLDMFLYKKNNKILVKKDQICFCVKLNKVILSRKIRSVFYE